MKKIGNQFGNFDLDSTMLLDKDDYLKLIEGYQPLNKDIELMQYVFFFQHDESAIIDKMGAHMQSSVDGLPKKS